MPSNQLASLAGQIRRWVSPPADTQLEDAQLLSRFIDHGDHEAFSMLVRCYGPMVLGVARRVLGPSSEADDVYQAAFLVLIRKAKNVDRLRSVGCWLHKVAYRLAHRARAGLARRRAKELAAGELRETSVEGPEMGETSLDTRRVLEEEIDRLQEKYRAPLVLCYFLGKTNEEAARELGWTKGTVSGRLARARDMLRGRLTRRGLALSAVTISATLEQPGWAATVLPSLETALVEAATPYASGLTSGVSLSVLGLVQSYLSAETWIRVKIVLGVVLACMCLGGGVFLARENVGRQGRPGAVSENPASANPLVDEEDLDEADVFPFTRDEALQKKRHADEAMARATTARKQLLELIDQLAASPQGSRQDTPLPGRTRVEYVREDYLGTGSRVLFWGEKRYWTKAETSFGRGKYGLASYYYIQAWNQTLDALDSFEAGIKETRSYLQLPPRKQ